MPPRRSSSSAPNTPGTPSPSPIQSSSPTKAPKNKRKGFDSAIKKEENRAKKARKLSAKDPLTSKSEHEELESAAKYYKRIIDMNIPFHMAVTEGVRIDGREAWASLLKHLPPSIASPPTVEEADPAVDDSDSDSISDGEHGGNEGPDEEFIVHCKEAWLNLIQNQPVIVHFVDYVAENGNVEGFLTLLAQMTEKCSDQMLWNDNNTLKTEVAALLVPSSFTSSVFVTSSPRKPPKEERGIQNKLMLEQLLSWDDIIDYRNDDELAEEILDTYRSIVDPKFLKAFDLPALLYNPEMVVKEDPTKGFLFSPFLIRCSQHILTSESSVSEEPGKMASPKKRYSDNASKMEMYKVPIQFIAYLATIVQFAISTVPRWGSDDKTFVFYDFYYWIIQGFRKMLPDDQQAVLKFWNKSIFGNENGRPRKAMRSVVAEKGSDADLFMKQCEEMASEAAAAAAVTAPPIATPDTTATITGGAGVNGGE